MHSRSSSGVSWRTSGTNQICSWPRRRCQEYVCRLILIRMKLYRSRQGIVAEHDGILYAITASSWDELIVRENLGAHLAQLVREARPLEGSPLRDLHPPIGGQEVWAAGV